MSRIIVVTSSPPLAEGGHTIIARSLVRALREEGHQAEVLITPDHGFGREPSSYLETWRLKVERRGHAIDQVISLRYPSYAIRHPRHVCWLNHTMREYYDLWPQFRSGLSPAARVTHAAKRRALRLVDRYLLTRNVDRLFVQSRTVLERMSPWRELRAEVLYPPAPQRAYRTDGYGDYILMVSRLTPLKRADLLIRALSTPDGSDLRAVIAGDGEDYARLDALIRSLGLSGRIMLEGPIAEPRLLDHLARCRAVCFPPLGEDYGFVTTEAFASGKAVVTCSDSGGPAELVEDGVTGRICDPEPAALARALQSLMRDRNAAVRMGEAGRLAAAKLTWSATVRALTGYDG